MKITEKIIHEFDRRGWTLAAAESCTGGLLAAHLTDVPGASRVFRGGIVAYANDIKENLLLVPAKIIKHHGAVSQATAEAMAVRVREILTSDFGIGITGLAGPGGGTARKPVGLVYIAVANEQEVLCVRCQFSGDRLKIRRQAVRTALQLLKEFLPADG